MNGLQMKYFVLNPTKNDAYGLASRMAILAYATQIYSTNQQLATELRKWVTDIDLSIQPEKDTFTVIGA